MRTFKIALSLLMIFCFSTHSHSVQANIGGFLKNVENIVVLNPELTDSKIAKGLKEALKIGTENAVDIVSKVNGYLRNPKIKIPLPSQVRDVERTLRNAGLGSYVDSFIESMNHAAETAAPEAKALFWDAIKKMTITDARQILEGSDDAATLYFKDKTQTQLIQKFKPIVNDTMSQVGVTSTYQKLYNAAAAIPFVEIKKFDLDAYVTGRAVDGLFYMVAQEEKEIRTDPAARVTKLLQEVFAEQ